MNMPKTIIGMRKKEYSSADLEKNLREYHGLDDDKNIDDLVIASIYSMVIEQMSCRCGIPFDRSELCLIDEEGYVYTYERSSGND